MKKYLKVVFLKCYLVQNVNANTAVQHAKNMSQKMWTVKWKKPKCQKIILESSVVGCKNVF